MPLSDAKLRALKPRETQYKVADYDALYVLVTPKGSLLWRMGYRFGGKEKTLSFGKYPVVTLAEARRLRDDARRTLGQGQDPSVIKARDKQEVVETQGDTTFKTVADRWFRSHETKWVSSYAVRLRNRMVDDIYPTLGAYPIKDITAQEVLKVIRLIEGRGAVEMARRVWQMVNNVFMFAVGEGIIARNPVGDIRHALAPKKKPKRRSALREHDLGEFFRRLDSYQGDPVTIAGLKVAAHTFLRTAEIRFAVWDEFRDLDGSNPEWRIPAARMKISDDHDNVRHDHIVPLSRQVVQVFRELRDFTGGTGWVFPSPVAGKEGQPISENTLIYAMYKLGYHSKATVHGFRSTASTILNENDFNRDWVELQLAHVDASIRGIYNAALWLPQRRRMMQWYSDFLEAKRASALTGDMFSDLLG